MPFVWDSFVPIAVATQDAMRNVANDPAYQRSLYEQMQAWRPYTAAIAEVELTRSIQRRFDRCCHR